MRYAKIIDNKIEYITNVAIGEGLIEFPDDIKYPVYLDGKIVEGYNEDIANYIQGNIDLDELKQKLIEKLRKKYIQMFRQTDDILMMRTKRKELGMWTREEEAEYENALSDYKKTVIEYRTKKNEINKLTNKDIINYYVENML